MVKAVPRPACILWLQTYSVLTQVDSCFACVKSALVGRHQLVGHDACVAGSSEVIIELDAALQFFRLFQGLFQDQAIELIELIGIDAIIQTGGRTFLLHV